MVNFMGKQNLSYHLFLFLSTFSRGLVEVFSLVLLSKKGFSLREISLFLFLTYLVGIFSCFVSIRRNKNLILIISNICYGVSFLYLSWMSYSYRSLFLLAILLSFSNYSYHTIRHYYAFCMLDNKNNTNAIVTMMYLGRVISSLIGSLLLEYFSSFFTSVIVLVVSILSCIPIFLYREEKKVPTFSVTYYIWNVRLGKNKFIFSILEQFKVLFMELQPLFIYLYVKGTYLYIGVFQIIMNLASLFVVFFLVRHVSTQRFRYVTIFLGVVLFIKINFRDNLFLFVIALLEGILVKLYETFSLKNLYDICNCDIGGYLMKEEFIFLFSKAIVMFFLIVFPFSFKGMLSFCILGIIASGFFISDK